MGIRRFKPAKSPTSSSRCSSVKRDVDLVFGMVDHDPHWAGLEGPLLVRGQGELEVVDGGGRVGAGEAVHVLGARPLTDAPGMTICRCSWMPTRRGSQ